MKKQYNCPKAEVLPITIAGSVMTTSNVLPPDMAPARRSGSNSEVF